MMHVCVQLDRGGFALDVAIRTDTHITGVFGPSGAGKSTLIHLIAGLERPARGTIEVDGHTLFDSARGIDVPAHRRRVGVVFQEHRLFPHMSVESNLLYGRPRGHGADQAEFRRIVEVLDVRGLLGRRVTQISGGERQRVALGRALMSQPRLLLLDEPLASLDRRLKQQIIPYLERVRDLWAVPMLYVSHELTEVLQLTDRLVVLEKGTVVGHGRYVDLAHDAAVVSVVHDRGMNNVLRARVVRHEPAEGVSVVQLGIGDDPARQLIVSPCTAAVGAETTLAVQPWDVALASEAIGPTSIRNQIGGTVRRCSLHEQRAVVEVDIGVPLIVEISRRSATSMRIESGQAVVCLIKSHAIRHMG